MEEGNVRGDIPGSRSRDIGYEFVNFRRPVGASQEWVEERHSGISAGPGTEGAGTRVCGVRNKEQ